MPVVEITGLCGTFRIVGIRVNTNEAPGLADEFCIFFPGQPEFIMSNTKQETHSRLRDYNLICEHGNYCFCGRY